MHYSSTAFTKDAITPLYTITLKNGKPFTANRGDFSDIDLKEINAIYCSQPPLDDKTCAALADLGMCNYAAVCSTCSLCKSSGNTGELPNAEGDGNCNAWAGRGHRAI